MYRRIDKDRSFQSRRRDCLLPKRLIESHPVVLVYPVVSRYGHRLVPIDCHTLWVGRSLLHSGGIVLPASELPKSAKSFLPVLTSCSRYRRIATSSATRCSQEGCTPGAVLTLLILGFTSPRTVPTRRCGRWTSEPTDGKDVGSLSRKRQTF